jgi:hypothetical protein
MMQISPAQQVKGISGRLPVLTEAAFFMSKVVKGNMTDDDKSERCSENC